MNNKIFGIMILGLFMFSLVSAASCGTNDIGTFKQAEQIQLRQTCDSCTYVNLSSLTYPNSTLNYINTIMTKQGIEYNYSFSNTLDLGTYYYVVAGDKDGGFASETFCFDVTPSGTIFTNALSIPLFLPMILMLLMAFFFMYLKNNLDEKYTFATLIGAGFFLFLTISFGIVASREVLFGFPNLYNFVNSFYKIFIVAVPVITIITVIVAMFYVIKKVFSTKGYIITK